MCVCVCVCVCVITKPVLSGTKNVFLFAETLHVAYFRCEPELLVFGVSANLISAQYLGDITRDLTKLLLVIYGSLQLAFKETCNQMQMDQFLKVRQKSDVNTNHVRDSSSHWLHLSVD